jgi:hypothetical protein
MRAAIAAIALSVAAAAPIGAARAQAVVTFGLETPAFGVRIGAPYPVAPVYPAQVYVAPPLYAPPVVHLPPPVVYLPPPVAIRPPAIHPVVHYYGPPWPKHRRHPHRAPVVVVPGGYAYGRY